MSEVMLLWALGRSKRLRFLVPVYEAVLQARMLGQAAVRVRGVRWDGEVFDLDGVLRRRSDTPETDEENVTLGEPGQAAGQMVSDGFRYETLGSE